MDLLDIRQYLDRFFTGKKNAFSLESGASETEILSTEKELKISFPSQVKVFYETYNGLIIKDPKLEIYPINKLKFIEVGKLEFALIDGIHPLYFETASLNHANQWNIITKHNYLVTMTMASFWSNKIWAWIRSGRTIWEEEHG